MCSTSFRDQRLYLLKTGSGPVLWPSVWVHQSRQTRGGSLRGSEGRTGQVSSKLTTTAFSRANLVWDEAEAGAGDAGVDVDVGGALMDPSAYLKLLILLYSC